MKNYVIVACAFAVIGLAAWYALSAGTRAADPARLHAMPPAPLDARGAALANEIARLRRAQPPSAAPKPGRDLFRFVAARPRVAPAPVVLPVPVEPQTPPRPPLKLIGVAEDVTAGNRVRTAIISAPDQLYVVKEGDAVTPRFDVARISPDVVELVDRSDSSAFRLALK